MKRFNYLPAKRFDPTSGLLHGLSYIDASRRMQYAFLWCAFAVLGCSIVSLYENIGVRVANARYEKAHVRLEQADRRLAGLKNVTRVVERMGATAHEVADVRGQTVAHLQEIEDVGDHLSGPRVGLLRLHQENGILHLRGRARSAADLGQTLNDLHGVAGLQDAKLDGLHAIEHAPSGVVEFDVLFAEANP